MADDHFAELARRLSTKAAGDVAALRELVDKEHVPDSAVGFFAQQAAEKTFKALLARRGVRFERTHDLARLAQQLAATGIELPVAVEQVAELTPWAVELRYDDPVEWEALDRASALDIAERILRWADELLG